MEKVIIEVMIHSELKFDLDFPSKQHRQSREMATGQEGCLSALVGGASTAHRETLFRSLLGLKINPGRYTAAQVPLCHVAELSPFAAAPHSFLLAATSPFSEHICTAPPELRSQFTEEETQGDRAIIISG